MLRAITVPCPRCAQPVTLSVSDAMTVVNGPYMSAVILQHPKHTLCPSCGLTVAPAISGVKNLDVIATPVPPAEQEQRVLVPSSPKVG